MRIFHQLVFHRALRPTSGDQITELNLMRALSRFARVDYAGQPFNASKEDGGLTPGSTPTYPKRSYDLYYVRNNPRLFTALPGPKIYLGTPYDREAFESATAVATYTDAWTRRLREGEPSPCLYPPGTTFENVITLHQVLDAKFVPRQDAAKTRELRARFGGDFVIGHFGRVVESCYPHSFLRILPELKRRFPGLVVVFGGGSVDHPHVRHERYDHAEVPYALSACDLILYNERTEQGAFAGCMKVLEAMGCGVPVLAPRVEARVEQLGAKYELFHDYAANDGHFPEAIERQMLDTISTVIRNTDLRRRLSAELLERSQFYHMEASAGRLQATLESVIERHRRETGPAPKRSARARYFAAAVGNTVRRRCAVLLRGTKERLHR